MNTDRGQTRELRLRQADAEPLLAQDLAKSPL